MNGTDPENLPNAHRRVHAVPLVGHDCWHDAADTVAPECLLNLVEAWKIGLGSRLQWYGARRRFSGPRRPGSRRGDARRQGAGQTANATRDPFDNRLCAPAPHGSPARRSSPPLIGAGIVATPERNATRRPTLCVEILAGFVVARLADRYSGGLFRRALVGGAERRSRSWTARLKCRAARARKQPAGRHQLRPVGRARHGFANSCRSDPKIRPRPR